MKKFSFSKIVATAILGAMVFSGCGSDDDAPLAQIEQPSTVSGQGLAAYISGGNAFIDCDRTGTFTTGDINASDTNATGHFSVTAQMCANYDIVISGGTNSATGLVMKYPTIAPKGYTKVSPLTTMLASLTETERTELLAVLNISTTELNTDYNNVPKLAAIKSFVETALTTSTSIDDVKKVATSFKVAVNSAAGNGTIDFTSDSNLTALTTQLATKLAENNVTGATDLNTSLIAQKTAIAAIATATTETLATALNTAEQKTATAIVNQDENISKVGIASVELNSNSYSVVNNSSFEANITAASSVENLFPITVNGLSVSKTFASQTVSISATIEDNNSNVISLSLNDVTISGSENNTSTITIPVDTEVVFTASSGLSNLVTAMGSTRLVTATNVAKTYTNSSELVYEDITSRLTSEKRAAINAALLGYFNQVGTYTVTIKVTGHNGTKVYIPTVTGTINVQASK